MRPLTSTNSPHAAHLADLTRTLKASMILIASTLPNGQLRIVRPGNLGPSLSRLYLAGGQQVDSVSWAAILGQQAIRSSDFLASRNDARQQYQSQWIGRLGFANAIVAPLASPVLPEMPGVIMALRGVGDADFTDADLHTLSAGAKALDADSSFSADARLGYRPRSSNRLFIAAGNGQFLGRSPMVAEIDRTLAEKLEAFAKTHKGGKDGTSGDRVLFTDSAGEAQAFTVTRHESYPALGHGPVTVLVKVPNYTDWLELRADDFAADEEIGRLLPAFRFMHDNFADGITLPAIAKHVHLSPFHFHRRFTELLGITPKHFLYDCQIARAKELLLESTEELEKVAKLCGFAHQSHFTSRFKQATGLTPTRWRKAKLGATRSATNGATARVG
jgi:AraC-like DNA-binding protein